MAIRREHARGARGYEDDRPPCRENAGGKEQLRMRTMLVIWLTLIATGLIFYSVIGLAHN